MTPAIFQPLHNAIIWAHHSADPIVWEEASRRFQQIEEQVTQQELAERAQLEEQLYRLLPSDWPLWMECCRPADADLNLRRDRAAQN